LYVVNLVNPVAWCMGLALIWFSGVPVIS